MITVGMYIKDKRKSKGFTQQDLADMANLSKSYISRIENNTVHPSYKTLSDLAIALDISLEELIFVEYHYAKSDSLSDKIKILSDYFPTEFQKSLLNFLEEALSLMK